MSSQKFQYAELPTYTYHSFEKQYQTFDRSTLKFSFYPVVSKASGLTGGKVQDNKEPSAIEPPKESTPAAEVKAEEPSSSPDESSSTPEPAGKYTYCGDDLYINRPGQHCLCCVTFTHLNYVESSEATTLPADDQPAEAANASGEDAKVEIRDAAGADEAVPNAESDGAPDEAAPEHPAEEVAEPEKADESSAPAEDDNATKPSDEGGSNGQSYRMIFLHAVN